MYTNNHKSLQVTTLGRNEPTIETKSFLNHTECHCVNRTAAKLNLTSTARSTTNRSATNRTQPNDNKCMCVQHFIEVAIETNDEDNDGDGRKRCRCDCIGNNDNCEVLKQGIEGFGIADRRYVHNFSVR